MPLGDNPALNKIGPSCTPWIIFCTRVHRGAKHLSSWGGQDPSWDTSVGINSHPPTQKKKQCTRPYRRDVALTWPWIHRSGCGKNSCTATGRSSPGKQVHLRPRRAPAAGRATFWPTFTHTQPDYMRPSLRPQKSTWLAFSLNLYQFYPHGFLPPLRCPIVIRLLWVLR